MAFVAPACAVQPDAATESTQAVELGATTETSTCNGRSPGLPIPVDRESEYLSCNSTCVHNGGDIGRCKQGCCGQVTGCSQCYFQ
jgi:hypothetical protein